MPTLFRCAACDRVSQYGRADLNVCHRCLDEGHGGGHREGWEKEPPSEAASALGRALAAQRKLAAFRCVVCGAEFEAIPRSGEKAPLYCSPACSQKAYRGRKDARAPRRRE